jgi:hypothetical protein
VPVPEGFELVDLIEDNGFESSVAGFEAGSPFDGSVATTTVDPIEGLQSLQVTLNGFGRVSSPHEYPFEGGPFADSVSVGGKLRVESATAPGLEDEVCVVVYIQNESNPESTCQSFPVDPAHVAEFLLTQNTAGRQLARVYFELKRSDGGTTVAALDDAHFYVVQEKAG